MIIWMMMRGQQFSCVHWPSTYPIWEKLCSHLLSFFPASVFSPNLSFYNWPYELWNPLSTTEFTFSLILVSSFHFLNGALYSMNLQSSDTVQHNLFLWLSWFLVSSMTKCYLMGDHTKIHYLTSFMGLALRFRSLIHFEVLYVVRGQVHRSSFVFEYLPVLCLEDFSPLNWLGTLIDSQSYCKIMNCFWTLNSSVMMSLSVLSPALHSRDYWQPRDKVWN